MEDEIKQKIVIFGAFGAGKTTLIRTIDPKSTHIEANCAGGTTTVALDFGRVELDGRQIHVYGTPGQERFEFAREIIAKGMDGAVLLVDASSPPDEFTRHLYESLTMAKVPFVVFLNKCDAKAPVPADFASAFGTSPVWTVSALDKKQCFGAIRRFTETLPVRVNGSGKQ
jgi:uncharacterized protein